ncbi:ATP-dependent nuclease [Hyphomicrobium sp. DMF-1]|uniref:ATP-dependent nuclease n=1 Tax=Hyphomicrobium sp. DMF-1 TaxID=3019544 RepID=UPI0022EBA50D|nr:ATP-dependent endonuclease [Hyphomicrobium sp. DMF-1]WBT37796.1 ATP-dependent endonuclease [Hyphomicrobium sp. DMF-1]
MQLTQIDVGNFRLLREVSISLEKDTTVIVGRNNSGKTSLTEVLKRLLVEKSASFRLEDFSFVAHEEFWNAYLALSKGETEPAVRELVPYIQIKLAFSYTQNENLGQLSEAVIDLDPNCTTAIIMIRYALRDGALKDLYTDITSTDPATKPSFFKALKERIPDLFTTSLHAVDPSNPTNTKPLDLKFLSILCASGFISAQRGLDDVSHKDRVVIGRVLENLFNTAKSNKHDVKDHATAGQLEAAVKDIQDKIGSDFNDKLNALLPALKIFGYPGLTGSNLRTETTLDVEKLLSNHTKVLYTGQNGVHLPEAYNGLGVRNLILILLQLREFFKQYAAAEPQPAVHLIFIEEPEVHLHPQMQEVFIRKLADIAAAFTKELGIAWPVQFIVTTHSSHVANEARFEAIRYFLSNGAPEAPKTVVRDLRKGLGGSHPDDREFLHQYLTLTRCDLFFAEKAILIEGTSERLLLPRIIRKLDTTQPEGKKLGSQYISTIEVGGAYAHLFFDLLSFLDLQTLVVTDIDTIKLATRKKCLVCEGEGSSNACINKWYDPQKLSGEQLVAVPDAKKVVSKRRIAYQIPEKEKGPCGSSFEQAFILANPTIFKLSGKTSQDLEQEADDLAREQKKSEFALKYATTKDDWAIPKYIKDGLMWLAEDPSSAPASKGTP